MRHHLALHFCSLGCLLLEVDASHARDACSSSKYEDGLRMPSSLEHDPASQIDFSIWRCSSIGKIVCSPSRAHLGCIPRGIISRCAYHLKMGGSPPLTHTGVTRVPARRRACPHPARCVRREGACERRRCNFSHTPSLWRRMRGSCF